MKDYIEDFINGELLGDGHLNKICNKYGEIISVRYQHGTKYKRYLEWLSDIFDKYDIKQCGNITSYVQKSGFGKGKISNRYSTLSYKLLIDLYNKWYKSSKKIVPNDLKLNPITIRQWYIGDGSLQRKDNTFSLKLATCAFSKNEVMSLVNKLHDIGINSSMTNDNRIYISVYSIIDFFNYIGECPKEIEDIYGYKWIDNKEKSQILLKMKKRYLNKN